MFLQYLSQCAWSAWDKKLFGKGDFVKTDKVVNIFCRPVGGINLS